MQTGLTDSGGEIITARGTGDGLVIRLKVEGDNEFFLQAVKDYVSERKSFLEGNSVILDWTNIPSDSLQKEVKACLKNDFNISIKESKLGSESDKQSFVPPRKHAEANKSRVGLFGGIESLSDSIETEMEIDLPEDGASSKSKKIDHNFKNSVFWDNPDAMIVHATLRSGQKIETENSIVLIGDVNCGAEITAGGDVIVLGTLRGVVHAGAYDETGGGRFIFSLDLQPTQLRIGSIISRGEAKSAKVPEMAYVDGNMIVVEYYSPRRVANR